MYQQEYEIALNAMEEESAKLGLHISWAKIRNLRHGPSDPPITINNKPVEAVTALTNLDSILSSCSNSSDEC